VIPGRGGIVVVTSLTPFVRNPVKTSREYLQREALVVVLLISQS